MDNIVEKVQFDVLKKKVLMKLRNAIASQFTQG
jgi:hypothetical protein